MHSILFQRKSESASMHLGKYGLVDSYAKRCTANTCGGIVGDNVLPCTTLAPTESPISTNVPSVSSSQPSESPSSSVLSFHPLVKTMNPSSCGNDGVDMMDESQNGAHETEIENTSKELFQGEVNCVVIVVDQQVESINGSGRRLYINTCTRQLAHMHNLEFEISNSSSYDARSFLNDFTSEMSSNVERMLNLMKWLGVAVEEAGLVSTL